LEVLSEAEFKRCKEVFWALDVDGSGNLEKEEVLGVFGGEADGTGVVSGLGSDPNPNPNPDGTGVFSGLGSEKPIEIQDWIAFMEEVKTSKGSGSLT